METASSQPDDAVLPLGRAADVASVRTRAGASGVEPELLEELCRSAEAEACGLGAEEFAAALQAVGLKHHFGLAPGEPVDSAARAAFWRGLRLPELALAQACALGREAAWVLFIDRYRGPLTQAAVAITGSATLGHDLADSLYSELYGLREQGGERRSPLGSYSGRGSLIGWLRTTLAQRHVDHHRRTRRETPLEDFDAPAAAATAQPLSAELARLTQALGRTLGALAAEDRFVLSAYFLDRRTLLEIARTLRVSEATISRRIKRLGGDLRKQLLGNLQSGGLSKRAAEEALGTDPRDIEINLRRLLQTSGSPPF